MDGCTITAQYTTQEKLLLAQAVHKLGAVQWPEISALLVQHPCCAGRPGELFSPEACEAAYVSLMADAGMNVPAEDGAKPAAKTHLHLAQTFYFARMAELKKAIADSEAVFVTLVHEIQRIKAGELDQTIAAELRAALTRKYGKEVVDAWVPVEAEVKSALNGTTVIVEGQAAAGENDTATSKAEKVKDATGHAQDKEATVNEAKHGEALPAPTATAGNAEEDTEPTTTGVAQKQSPTSPARPVSARDKRATRRDTAESAQADSAIDIEGPTPISALTPTPAAADAAPITTTHPEGPERPSSRNTRRTTRNDDPSTPSTPAPVSAGVGSRKSARGRDAQGEADTKEEEERLVEASILPAADSPIEPSMPEIVKETTKDAQNDAKDVAADITGPEAEDAAKAKQKEAAGTEEAEGKEERPVPRTRKSGRRESKIGDTVDDKSEAIQPETDRPAEAKASDETAAQAEVPAEAEADDKASRPSRRSGRTSDPAPATPVTAAEEPSQPPKKKMGRPRKYPRPDDVVMEYTEKAGDLTQKEEEKDVATIGEGDEAEPQSATSGIAITIDPPPKKRGRPSRAHAEAKDAKAAADAASEADDADEKAQSNDDEQQEDAPRSARSPGDKRNQAQVDASDASRPSRTGRATSRTATELDENRLSPTKPSSRPSGRTLTRSPVKASAGISASPASPLSDLSELETPEDDGEGDASAPKSKSGADAPAAPKRRGRPPRKSKGDEPVKDEHAKTAKEDVKEGGQEDDAEEPPETATSTRSGKRKAGRPPAGAPGAKSNRTSRTSGRPRKRISMAESEDEASEEEEDEDEDEEADDAGDENEVAEEKVASQGKAKATTKGGMGRKRKTREESEEQVKEEAEDEQDGAEAETVDEEDGDDDEDEDDGTETEPEPSTTRRGTRRSLPSSSLNPASASAASGRGRRRDSAIAKPAGATTHESPTVTSPAASTSRRGGSVMSSSYRESTHTKDKEKEQEEEPSKPRRGRPPKKREPSAEPVRETPAKGTKRAKQDEKEKEQEDDRPSTAGRTSRRTKGLPVDEGEEDEDEKDKEKESRDKRGKRNSLRMSSARRDTDEPSPGPSTGRRASGSGQQAHHRHGRAVSVSSMTPGLEDGTAPASASGSRPTTATGTAPGPSTRGVNKEHIANIIAQAQSGEDDRAAPRARDNSKEGKAMRGMLLGLLENIAAHRNGSVFEKPVRKTDATDYFDIVKRPMDLKTVRSRIKDGRIANLEEFTRDVQLIFANAMIYNKKGDQMYDMAVEMLEEAESKIVHFETMQQDLARRRG